MQVIRIGSDRGIGDFFSARALDQTGEEVVLVICAHSCGAAAQLAEALRFKLLSIS